MVVREAKATLCVCGAGGRMGLHMRHVLPVVLQPPVPYWTAWRPSGPEDSYRSQWCAIHGQRGGVC
jgi:hypothetical protein